MPNSNLSITFWKTRLTWTLKNFSHPCGQACQCCHLPFACIPAYSYLCRVVLCCASRCCEIMWFMALIWNISRCKLFTRMEILQLQEVFSKDQGHQEHINSSFCPFAIASAQVNTQTTSRLLPSVNLTHVLIIVKDSMCCKKYCQAPQVPFICCWVNNGNHLFMVILMTSF